jgi:hypothetical protein
LAKLNKYPLLRHFAFFAASDTPLRREGTFFPRGAEQGGNSFEFSEEGFFFFKFSKVQDAQIGDEGAEEERGLQIR